MSSKTISVGIPLEPSAAHPRLYHISARLSADVYINPVAGRELFDPAVFAKEGVDLRFLDFKPFVYATPGYGFESGLSILDVLMWNGPDVVAQAIRENSFQISARKQHVGACSNT